MLTRSGLPERLDAAFAPFIDASGVLVGVSGGPDSMALLRLTQQWAATTGRPKIFAATVDHGLRPDSRAEAQTVAEWCATLGAPHRLLVWEGTKPATRIQEKARAARYLLLDACADELGCNVLLTAHHLDDQAETILFRMGRGSGIAGLAGMQSVSQRGGLRHGRPLLGVPKAELIRFCIETRQPFVTDPSNADPRYARARLRRAAPELAAAGLDAPTLSKLAGRARRADEALRQVADAALDRLSIANAPDLAVLDGAGLRAEPPEIVLRVLDSCIRRIGGNAATRLERLERFTENLLAALERGAPFRSTIGGAIVTATRDKTVRIAPEPPRRSHCLVNKLSTNSDQA